MPRVNVKDKRKQQLMEANIASIARRGLVDTTIAHVSKGADMSRGIVNFYFTSKEKMMQETLAFLAEEYTSHWQNAVALKSKETDSPSALIETIIRSVMGDKLCSAKRMAVWAAFIGHAGSHAGYAKILRSMDETLVKQLKELWQKLGADNKAADLRARQVIAFMRGHHLMSALGVDDKRPSFYNDAWLELLHDGDAASGKEAVKSRPAHAAKPKKPVSAVLPGQLDFGDLFSKKS